MANRPHHLLRSALLQRHARDVSSSSLTPRRLGYGYWLVYILLTGIAVYFGSGLLDKVRAIVVEHEASAPALMTPLYPPVIMADVPPAALPAEARP